MSKQSKKVLSDEELAEMADKLVKEIQDAGGMEKYYDGLFGKGSFNRDLARYIEPNGTIH